MELRVLNYFLTIAREGSMTNAANVLHITQPTLSRQIRDLEAALGHPLFIRGSHSLSLTPEGILLRKRAEEILDLVRKTEQELSQQDEALAGDIYIGAGETVGVHFLTEPARALQKTFPHVRFHISSGDSRDVCEQLDRGLIDFGLLFGPVDPTKYHAIPLPHQDTWGVLMRKDSPLSQYDAITPELLRREPLILSRQSEGYPLLTQWFGAELSQLNIVGTYSLLFNGSLMVEDGMGYALGLDQIIHSSENSPLCFRPLSPKLEADMHIVWKKQQVFSKAARHYLDRLLERT